jgi:hypothetical protein
MPGSRGGKKCIHCDPKGSGICSECFGTGQNVHLNSPEPKCPRCAGSGQCPVCRGSGKTSGFGAEETGSSTPSFFAKLLERLGMR